jgi:hypothetical protein
VGHSGWVGVGNGVGASRRRGLEPEARAGQEEIHCRCRLQLHPGLTRQPVMGPIGSGNGNCSQRATGRPSTNGNSEV